MPNDRDTIALPGLHGWRFERTAVTSSFYNLVNRDGASAVTLQEARAFVAALTAQPAPVAGQPSSKTCELVGGGVGLNEIERLVRSIDETKALAVAGYADHRLAKRHHNQIAHQLESLKSEITALARPVSSQDAGVVKERDFLTFRMKLETYRCALVDNREAIVGAGIVERSEADLTEFVRTLRTTPPSDQPEKAEASASDQGRVRDAALEEAAQVADLRAEKDRRIRTDPQEAATSMATGRQIAASIRALKQSTQPAQARWHVRHSLGGDGFSGGTDGRYFHSFTDAATYFDACSSAYKRLIVHVDDEHWLDVSDAPSFWMMHDDNTQPTQAGAGVAGQVPDGWKMVPPWTNRQMRLAMRRAVPSVPGDILDEALSAALAAAPQPPTDPSSREGVKAEGDGIRNAGHSYLTPEALHPIVETAADRRRKAEGQDGNAGGGRG